MLGHLFSNQQFFPQLVACVVLCIEANPLPPIRPQGREGPFAALQRFLASTFGFSSPVSNQEKLATQHYEGSHLPSDEHILNGLIGFQRFRQGLNNVQHQ